MAAVDDLLDVFDTCGLEDLGGVHVATNAVDRGGVDVVGAIVGSCTGKELVALERWLHFGGDSHGRE